MPNLSSINAHFELKLIMIFFRRLMAFMKGFVISRSQPCPNLVKRYCLQTLLRRCPSSVRREVDARLQLVGAKRKKGLLISVHAILAEGKNKPGSGRLIVTLSTRNYTEVSFTTVSLGFKAFMTKYNRTHAPSFRFLYAQRNSVTIREMKPAKGVSLDGRDLRVNGPLGVQWTVNEAFAVGMRLGRVDRVHIGTVAGMTFLEASDGRELIIFKVCLSCTNWAYIVHIMGIRLKCVL